MGHSVIAADLDPQSNLTSMFLNESRLEELWPEGKHPNTIYGVVEPILRGVGDIRKPYLESLSGGELALLAGDLALSTCEDELSDAWLWCHNRDEAAFRTTTAFYRAILCAKQVWDAELLLIDVGPNLGAINRAVLIASEYVVVPLAADLFSIQGLRNLGPQLRRWRETWGELHGKSPNPDLPLPSGSMRPAGYVLLQHASRADRPVKAYLRWMDRIPGEYRRSVLDQPLGSDIRVDDDPSCLAALKNYRSLMPLAMEARKPMFRLKPADGAIGAHVQAVKDCYTDFRQLAVRILSALGSNETAI